MPPNPKRLRDKKTKNNQWVKNKNWCNVLLALHTSAILTQFEALFEEISKTLLFAFKISDMGLKEMLGHL